MIICDLLRQGIDQLLLGVDCLNQDFFTEGCVGVKLSEMLVPTSQFLDLCRARLQLLSKLVDVIIAFM